MINSDQIQQNLANNQAFIHSVITKANQDASFKESLLANPEKTLKEFNSKFRLPTGFEVVIEDKPELNTIYMDFVKSEDVELTEEELETVSGGTIIVGCIVTWFE